MSFSSKLVVLSLMLDRSYSNRFLPTLFIIFFYFANGENGVWEQFWL